MKYLDPAVARAKLQVLVDGAAIVRRELGGLRGFSAFATVPGPCRCGSG
ncbi:MAG: hypothetical protein OXH59_00345 [Rhodospirillaceae bacterium]|nr:hypothetical protein [Rhodospirillaceae bacterium]